MPVLFPIPNYPVPKFYIKCLHLCPKPLSAIEITTPSCRDKLEFMTNPLKWWSSVRRRRQAELVLTSIASMFWAAQFRKLKSQLLKHILRISENRWVVNEFSSPRATASLSGTRCVYDSSLWQPAWSLTLRFQLPTLDYVTLFDIWNSNLCPIVSISVIPHLPLFTLTVNPLP